MVRNMYRIYTFRNWCKKILVILLIATILGFSNGIGIFGLGNLFKMSGYAQRKIGLPIVRILKMDPKNNMVIYAGTSDGLFKSSDGGETWSVTNIPNIYVKEMEISVQNPSNIYIGSEAVLYKTPDGGKTKTVIAYFYDWIGGLSLDYNNNSKVYMAVNRNLYKSTNGGKNWEKMSLQNTAIFDLIVSPYNSKILYVGTNKGIYKSTDEGKTWKFVKLTYTEVITISISSKKSSVIFAGTHYDGLYRSLDGGNTWEKIGLGNYNVNSVVENSEKPNIIYAGVWNEDTQTGGVLKTTDGGKTWKVVGLTEREVYSLILDFKNPDVIYAGTDMGIYKSIDGGKTWKQINKGLFNRSVSSIAINPKNSNNLYIGSLKNGIYKSTDGGKTFSCLGIQDDIIKDMVVNFNNHDEIYVASVQKIYKKMKDNDKWIELSEGLMGKTVQKLCMLSHNSNILYAICIDFMASGLESGLYKTTDGGKKWIKVKAEEGIFAIDIAPLKPPIVYVATDKGVYISTDNGKTWHLNNKGLPFYKTPQNRVLYYIYDLKVHPQNFKEVYVATNKGIYRSTDNGKTWNEAGLNNMQVRVLSISQKDVIYAGTLNKGLFRSTDRGKTWVKCGFENWEIYNISVDPHNPAIVYVGTHKGLFKSMDGGKSWKEIDVFKFD